MLCLSVDLQGGFTRILHSGRADDLMKEMPTFVAQPLPPDKHDHKGYVVLNRPYAINQARRVHKPVDADARCSTVSACGVLAPRRRTKLRRKAVMFVSCAVDTASRHSGEVCADVRAGSRLAEADAQPDEGTASGLLCMSGHDSHPWLPHGTCTVCRENEARVPQQWVDACRGITQLPSHSFTSAQQHQS